MKDEATGLTVYRSHPDRPFRVLGMFSTHIVGSGRGLRSAATQRELLQKAKTLGADGVWIVSKKEAGEFVDISHGFSRSHYGAFGQSSGVVLPVYEIEAMAIKFVR